MLTKADGRTQLVIGPGAIGLGVASALIQAGEPVTILARGRSADKLAQCGIRRDGVLGEAYAPPGTFEVAEDIDDLDLGSFDHLIVCVKTFDSATIAERIAARRGILNPQAKVVLLQNGWGGTEAFTAATSRNKMLSASVMTGLERISATHVRATVHARAVRLGCLATRSGAPASRIAAMMSLGGFSAEPTDRIDRDLWDKMCFNCSVNPLSAIFGVTIGELAASYEIRQIIESLIREIYQVVDVAGYEARLPTADLYLSELYTRLIPATARHRSSMMQDILAGRRTEIDSLNGAVVRLASRLGEPTPYNIAVYGLLRFAETLAITRRPGVGVPQCA